MNENSYNNPQHKRNLDKELIRIDKNKCIKCGNCVKACPSYVYEQIPANTSTDINNNDNDNENYPIIKYPEACIRCGHCLAICPTNAIQHSEFNPEDFKPVVKANIPYEEFLNLLKNRRSIRRYKQTPLKPEDIEKIKEALHFIPSAENDQALHYLFINNLEMMDQIRNKCYKKFSITKIALPFLPKKLKANVRTMLQKHKQGQIYLQRQKSPSAPNKNQNRKKSKKKKVIIPSYFEDPFLRTAPAMIIIYGKKNILRLWDAAIASNVIMNTCQTLGIGTVWNGIYSIIANMFPSIRKTSKIPRKYKVLGAICLGYPQIKYPKSIPKRRLDWKLVD
ncbi:MAG: nitroreductase family protein [Promethearchaeota archaeon]